MENRYVSNEQNDLKHLILVLAYATMERFNAYRQCSRRLDLYSLCSPQHQSSIQYQSNQVLATEILPNRFVCKYLPTWISANCAL